MPRDSLARVRALAAKLLDVEEGTTFGFPAQPRVFYVTPHYKDYPSVLARVDQMTDAALLELLESGHEFMTTGAGKAKGKRGPRAASPIPRSPRRANSR